MYVEIFKQNCILNKTCQKTTTLTGQQPSLNTCSSKGKSFSKVGQTSRSRSRGHNFMVQCERSCHKEYTCAI